METEDCPHCGKPVAIEVGSHVPESQVVAISLSSSTSSMIYADLLGETITTMQKCLIETAKAMGESVTVMVKDVRVTSGKVDLELVVARNIEPTRA